MNLQINANEMKAILQAMIFVSETPVTIKQMQAKLNSIAEASQNSSSDSPDEQNVVECVREALELLNPNYNTEFMNQLADSAINLVEGESSSDDVAPNESGVSQAMIKEWLQELQTEYQNPWHGFELSYVAKGYQFRTKWDVAYALQSDRKSMPSRLSPSALETLAIVAYEQPVARSKVDDVRGVDSGGVLKTLLDKEFLRIVGRADEPGQPLLYGTTPKFLEVFGLASLKDLPSLAEIKDLYLKSEDQEGDAPAQYFDPEEVIEERVHAMSEQELELMSELDESLNSLKDVENSINLFHAPQETSADNAQVANPDSTVH